MPISLLLPAPLTEITLYPVQLHALLLATFASLIAPFGGFFASGFKRAFKIKDFADSIPGHGGLTDRMDCQVMMGFFVYLYYSSFLKHHPLTAAAVLETAVGRLAPADQQLLYLRLHEYLVRQNMLPRL